MTGSRPQLTVPAMEALRTQAGVLATVLQQTGGAVQTRPLLCAHCQVCNRGGGSRQLDDQKSPSQCVPPRPLLTFVTEAPPPARLTDTLPRLLARSVAAARHRHAALAALSIPAGVTPGNTSSQVTSHVTHTYTHKGLTCRAPTRRSGCWCCYSCSRFLHRRTRRRRSQGSWQEAAYQNKSSAVEQEQHVADTRDFICHVMLSEVSPL